MSHWKINRRYFISSTGSMFLLPLLESFVSPFARAAGSSDPRRFIALYMPNGTYNRTGDAVWYPATGPLSGDLGLVLSPFAANKGDFSILKYIRMSARSLANQRVTAYNGVGGGHVSANTTYLTGQAMTDPSANYCTVPGTSFDQQYAQISGKQGLVLCGGGYQGPEDRIPFGYSGILSFKNGKEIQPVLNPVYLYNTLFANLAPAPQTSPGATPSQRAARNKSILDASLADINDLKSKVGKTDNLKLDEYFTNLRDLEQKILSSATPSAPEPISQCTPGTPPPQSLNNTDTSGQMQNYGDRMKAFFDIIILAFKCDLVRSVSFMYDAEGSDRVLNAQVPSDLIYNGVNMISAATHMGIAHYSTNQNGREKCITRDRYFMSLMMYLINGLKAAKDPSGSSILDNTIILNGFAVDDGSHSGGAAGVPIIVAGGKNFLNPGNSYDVSNYDLKDLIYTFSTYLNMGIANFAGNNTIVKI
ncbi:MAG: DUF1552 domain-containing protein [Pseudobdellovibrionaceae bacterium]